MRKALIMLLFALGLVHSSGVFAQQSDTTQVVVVTHDGMERIGVILQDDGRELLLDTKALGKIFIKKSDIKLIRPVDPEELEIYDGDYRSSGPFTTRYYLTNNALPIKKGEDYAMVHLYGPEVHFAVTDRLTMGAMTTWIASPFILALKYNIPTKNENLNFSLGTLMGSSTYLNAFEGFGGLHWASMTVGDRMNNFTISGGFLYLDEGGTQSLRVPGTYYADEFGFASIPREEGDYNSTITSPAISVAGIFKVGRKASFFFDSMFLFTSQTRVDDYTENFYSDAAIFEYSVVTHVEEDRKNFVACFMPGMRFQKTYDHAFQIALAGVTRISDDEVISFPAPTIAWLYKF